MKKILLTLIAITLILLLMSCSREKECQHIEEEIPEIAADCTNGGMSAGKKCSICAEILVQPVSTPPSHSYGDNGKCTLCGAAVKESEGLAYKLINDGKEYALCGVGTADSNEIYIPSMHEGLPVTEISAKAFNGEESITSIFIPSTVVKIGDSAFEGCIELSSVTIPNTLRAMGKNAFRDCNKAMKLHGKTFYIGNYAVDCEATATSIIIKEGTVGISDNAFADKVFLEAAELPSGLSFIGKAAFYECNSLKSVNIPQGIAEIPAYGFYGCRLLPEIIIPDTVTAVNDGAFYSCTSLTRIDIPARVRSIGTNAFYSCTSLSAVYAADLSSWLSIDFDDYGANPVSNSKCLYIGNSRLEDMTVPEDITQIKPYALYSCEGLRTASLHEGITKIGTSAFSGCISLEVAEIPSSVAAIGASAYHNCLSLRTADISDIEAWLKIDFMSYNSNPLYYAQELRINGVSLEILTVPESITKLKPYALYGCESLKRAELHNGVTEIGYHSFYDCSALEEFVMSDGCQKIAYGAFTGCVSLKEIEIPSGITEMGEYIFDGCESLTTVSIPKSVNYLGAYVFKMCSSLKTINYEGTRADWAKIDRVLGWNSQSGKYTVVCSDGNLDRASS